MERDSRQMRRTQAAVKKASMFVVLRYSEKDSGSLSMSQAFISPECEMLHNRRKIKSAHVERTIWGEGQAESLKFVVPSQFGTIGDLNCWEHLQPLLQYYEYMQSVQMHVAGWPAEVEMLDPQKIASLYHETGEASYWASQFMAIEGQFLCTCGVTGLDREERI